MREDNAEITFTHCGYECEVRIIRDSHRSGYVSVKKGHPLYGVYYGEVPDDFEPKVNGGLTYSRKEGDDWVFGFDFAHCWNVPDLNICTYKTAEDVETIEKMYPNEARYDTLEEVMNDCMNLAEALKEYEGREYVYDIDEWSYISENKPDAIMCNGVRYEKNEECEMVQGDAFTHCNGCGYTWFNDFDTIPFLEDCRYCPMCGGRVKAKVGPYSEVKAMEGPFNTRAFGTAVMDLCEAFGGSLTFRYTKHSTLDGTVSFNGTIMADAFDVEGIFEIWRS